MRSQCDRDVIAMSLMRGRVEKSLSRARDITAGGKGVEDKLQSLQKGGRRQEEPEGRGSSVS